MARSSPTVSVVIPAHDEERRIGGTLRTLLADADEGEFEVVVVCNGCSDDTAATARTSFGGPDITVLEIPQASKIAALRVGDEAAVTFPRIYLDADVALSTASARALAGVLADPAVRVAGVRADLDLRGASRTARWYYGFQSTLPVFEHGIIGAGVYAMSAEGRSRFGVWPDVLGDDQFVYRSFAPSERATVEGHRTRVVIDGGLAVLVRRGIRIRRGNRDLTIGATQVPRLTAPPAGIRTAVLRALRSPRAWPRLVTWVLVSVAIRVGARISSRGDWSATR